MKEFTCFLIDDDKDDQEIFLTVLEEWGPAIRCITASNGEEAIRKLANREVVPDLIFVDMNMPLMNGTQFLKERNRLDGVSTIPIRDAQGNVYAIHHMAMDVTEQVLARSTL